MNIIVGNWLSPSCTNPSFITFGQLINIIVTLQTINKLQSRKRYLWQKLKNTMQRQSFSPAFGTHYFKVMVNKHIKVPFCFPCLHPPCLCCHQLLPCSSPFFFFLGFRHNSSFPQQQNAVQGMWDFVQLHVSVRQLEAKMEQINAAHLHVLYDCNLAIFIKLISGIGSNLLKWHSFISWNNFYDKTFRMKISNWAITQDRSKQLSGPRSVIWFCWNRKFNFSVGTHLNVNLLEQLHFMILKTFRGHCNSLWHHARS